MKVEQSTKIIDNVGTTRYHLNVVRHRIGGPEKQGESMKLKKIKGLLSLKAVAKNSEIVAVVLITNLVLPILVILLADFIQFKITWTDIRVIVSLIFI